MVPGGADHSYGIEVARMAGLPEPVIERARQVLHQLESQHLVVEAAGEQPGTRGDGSAPAKAPKPVLPAMDDDFQMSLFAPAASDPIAEEIKEKLSALDPNRMTPIEALLTLAELKRLVGE